ncbi:hypothetical protein [Amycolatopsis sp. DSM 110486]|uniref:hypothetical protein n=1 Tax=Amycolatopsis sp. DSM 110486 TaxID=2865832 RepID=UPI001C69BAAF|nr:hypothetical protein K1T34_12110 [Amycolatopsis sp. DSM 110486]
MRKSVACSAPASTVHSILVFCQINRLALSTASPASRRGHYEHDHPRSLIHVDFTKFGNIPDSGWR